MCFSTSTFLIFDSLFYETIILLIIYRSIYITVVILKKKKSHQLQARQKAQRRKYVLNKFQISECRRFLIHSVRGHFLVLSVANYLSDCETKFCSDTHWNNVVIYNLNPAPLPICTKKKKIKNIPNFKCRREIITLIS